jgi:hypothetical protein
MAVHSRRVVHAEFFCPAAEGGNDFHGPPHRCRLEDARTRLPLSEPRHALLAVQPAPFGAGGLHDEQANRAGAEVDGSQPPHVSAC